MESRLGVTLFERSRTVYTSPPDPAPYHVHPESEKPALGLDDEFSTLCGKLNRPVILESTLSLFSALYGI